jgi:hypothetical protein
MSQTRDHRSVIELLLAMAGHTEVPVEFYLWSGMSLVAATLQNHVWFQHMAYKGIQPNLYVILVGPSGDGKGHAMSLAAKAAQAAQIGDTGMDLGLYAGKITEQALYDKIECKVPEGEAPYSIPVWLLSEELSVSIRTGDMARQFVKAMTDLWEKHDTVPRGDATRTGGQVFMHNPCLNWLGGSTMAWLKEVIDFNDVDSGFFARAITIQAQRASQPIYKPDTSQYFTLLPLVAAKLQTIWQYRGEMTIAPEAEAFEKQWYEVSTKEPPRKPFLYPSWKRRLDIMHKLAMILQCAEAKEDDSWSVIPLEVSTEAIRMYEELQVHYGEIVEGIILGKSDRRFERVVTFLQKYRDVTMARLQQSVSSYGVRKDELNSILLTLIDQESVQKYYNGRVRMIRWIGA